MTFWEKITTIVVLWGLATVFVHVAKLGVSADDMTKIVVISLVVLGVCTFSIINQKPSMSPAKA